MPIESPVSVVLQHPEVKKYLTGVLESDLSPEAKYSKIEEFFGVLEEVKDKFWSSAFQQMQAQDREPLQVLERASLEESPSDLSEMLRSTKSCVERALTRIVRCQHRDGGWGYEWETSEVWSTSHALMTLTEAKGEWEIYGSDEAVARGVRWLTEQSQRWSAARTPAGQLTPIYHASIAVRCLKRIAKEDVPDIAETIQRLAESQNEDGGWDANVYGPDWRLETGVWSEVGATAMALQAMAEMPDGLRPVAEKGIAWIVKQQNQDGSWNSGSCARERRFLSEKPSVTKTCDAIKGLLVGPRFGLDRHDPIIERAVDWILDQERLLLTNDGRVEGWGYRGSNLPDLDVTCLTLETLLKIESISLAHLTANAIWLIRAQHLEPGSIEDGKWTFGETFRIAQGLIRYYQRIRAHLARSPATQAVPVEA